MVKQLTFWIKLILISALFIGGQPGISSPRQEKKEQVSKKKPTQKKTARRKRPTTRKPVARSSTKRTRPTAQQSARRKPVQQRRPTSDRVKRTRPRAPVPRGPQTPQRQAQPAERNLPAFNPYEYSEEFYNLAEELNSSQRQLAKATSYLEPSVRKRTVKLDSESMSRANIETLESKAIANPDDYRTMRNLGLEYERIQNFNEAKDIYLRLITKDPLNPDYHYYLGSLYHKKGELNRAQQSFEEALFLDPQHRATLDVLSTLGRSPVRSGIIPEDVLKQTSRKDPLGPASQVSKIKKLISLEDYSSAVQEAEAALKEFPDYSGIKLLKGYAYEQLGENDRAKSIYQDAIKTDPMNPDGHRALADLYFKDGKYLYAGLAYSDVVYLDGSSVDERYLQGLSFFKTREWARAANAWEDLLRIRPDHELTLTYLPQVYYILAVEYNRKGESGLGRNSFNKAFSVNGNTRMWLPGALKTLGEYYREKNMFRESLAAYQEAAELAPNDGESYLGLGITYWKMNEPQLAIGAWKRSLEINPDNNESRGWMIIAKQGS